VWVAGLMSLDCGPELCKGSFCGAGLVGRGPTGFQTCFKVGGGPAGVGPFALV
jgi:hypothetical protein